ncbi:hypothetical protein [uncultured Kordia sp.]|uniref:hypothetical protein n=1 Tax=uncultured Kordia sp. TaxID=507699 RepID=UPI00260C2B1C|nr:hypothetical protein [uncultured Kordia sp.]
MQKKITLNIVLTKRQKILNSILIWLVPFVWYYLIKDLITDEIEIMTKEKRNKLRTKHDRNPHSNGNVGTYSGGDMGF